MNKLLRVELSRRLTSIIYIGEIILLLVYNFLEISGSTYGFEVNIPYFLFNKTTLICIFISINVSLKLSQELDNRTINNKLFCGYNKSTFYKTELLVGIIEGTLLLLADTISVILLGIFQNYELNISYIDLFINFIIAHIIISTVAIISTILSVLINNRIFSIFIVIGLTLLLLYGGKETVHTLNQPVQTTLFSIDGELRDNPLYAEGAERTIHNIHLFSSPYAQANYVPYLLHEEKQEKFDNSLILKNSPYHLEFLITDILGGIFLYLLGSYLFNKRNLQ